MVANLYQIFVIFLLAQILCSQAADDRPIQIVSPDKSHSNLVINEDALQLLNSINNKVAVVAGNFVFKNI